MFGIFFTLCVCECFLEARELQTQCVDSLDFSVDSKCRRSLTWQMVSFFPPLFTWCVLGSADNDNGPLNRRVWCPK